VKDLVELQQFLLLSLEDPVHGNSCPFTYDLGNLVFRHFFTEYIGALPFLFHGGLFFTELVLQLGKDPMLQFGCPIEIVFPLSLFDLPSDRLYSFPKSPYIREPFFLGFVACPKPNLLFPGFLEFPSQGFEPFHARGIFLLHQGRFLDLELHDFSGYSVQFRGERINLRPYHGTGFVHEVDGLVRQKTLCYVPVRQHRGGYKSIVPYLHSMVNLETILQPPEDRNGVFHRGLLHEHGLEPPRKGGILLDVLPVLVHSSGADAVKFSPRKHGFEHVSGVDGPLGGPRTDDSVEFVDEKNDPSIALFHFIEDGFQSLLELAPELRPRNKGTHVKGENGPVPEPLRYVSVDYPSGEPLDDGRFSYPGIPYEYRVVFRLPAQDPDHPSDFFVPPDHRIEFSRPGDANKVAAVLLQGVVGGFGRIAADSRPSPHIVQHREKLLLPDTGFS